MCIDFVPKMVGSISGALAGYDMGVTYEKMDIRQHGKCLCSHRHCYVICDCLIVSYACVVKC